MTGGINRLKYRLAKILGQNGKACTKLSQEVSREMNAFLVEYEMKKVEK